MSVGWACYNFRFPFIFVKQRQFNTLQLQPQSECDQAWVTCGQTLGCTGCLYGHALNLGTRFLSLWNKTMMWVQELIYVCRYDIIRVFEGICFCFTQDHFWSLGKKGLDIWYPISLFILALSPTFCAGSPISQFLKCLSLITLLLSPNPLYPHKHFTLYFYRIVCHFNSS